MQEEYTPERDLFECKNDGTMYRVDPRGHIATFLRALDQKVGLMLIKRLDDHLQNEPAIRQMCHLSNRPSLSGRDLWTQVATMHESNNATAELDMMRRWQALTSTKGLDTFLKDALKLVEEHERLKGKG